MKRTAVLPSNDEPKAVVVTPADRESPYWLLKLTDVLRDAKPDQTITVTIK